MTEFQEQVKNLVEEGKTHSEICKILNRAQSSVSSAIKSLGLTPKKAFINTVDENYLSVIDTDSKAYFLGFFIADGSVADKNRNHGRFSFNIQDEDGYILEYFANQLKCPSCVKHFEYQNGATHRKPQSKLRWTSKKMLSDLSIYNLGPRKTDLDFELPLNKIPEKFYGALIRGFIDGDGSFEQHDGIFNPVISGPNYKWLVQVSEIINKYTGLSYVFYEHEGKTCKWWTFRWKADSTNKFEKIKKLYEFLYSGAEICLKRKKDKIEAYLEYRAKQLSKEWLPV